MGIELLAPVGSFEAFKSALDNGANAIYLAGSRFGAREKATFSNEELIEIIKEAHINEVKVYVTVNTLIYDDEFEAVLEFVDFLYNNDCDAIIVQDLGLLTVVKNMYPDFVIHASTQMNTMTVKQARMLKNMGVSRVVVARETSIEVIKQIIEEVGIEVEVFIHGALCVSYSGQCLFSSCLAKKSGNRGECLQLCRLPYALYKNEEKITDTRYLLSMKDLNTLEYIKQLVDAKVTSLKIEGRLKNGSYVGMVTRTYKNYIDKYINEKQYAVTAEDEKNLEQVFNREFTRGYVFGETNNNIVNSYRPNNKGVRIGKVIDIIKNKVYIKLEDTLHQGDGIRIVSKEDVGFFVNMMEVKRLLVNTANTGEVVAINIKGKVEKNDIVYKTSDIKLAEEIEKNSVRKRFPVKANVRAVVGENLKIKFTDNLDNEVEVISEYNVIKANNSPTSQEKIKQQLSKLNESSYYLEAVSFDMDDMVLIPVSIINESRRTLVELLNEKRSKVNSRTGKKNLKLEEVAINTDEDFLKIKVNNDEQYELAKQYVKDENIYYRNSENIYTYPRISENKLKVKNKMVLLNELHDVEDKEMVANYYLNCTNIYTLYALYKIGFKRVTLSEELTKSRIFNMIKNYKKQFKENPNIEVVVYSKVDLLITKYCVINQCLQKDHKGCNECLKNKFYLEDRKGYKIPVLKDYYCNTRLLNPRALMLMDYVNELKENGVNCVRIEFNDESIEECSSILDYYNGKDIELDTKKFTYGHFKEKEDE